MLDAAMKEMINRFGAEKFDPELLRASEQGEWPEDLWHELSGLGLPRALLSAEEDGSDLSPAEGLELVRLINRAALPVPLGEAMFATWCARLAGLEIPAGRLALAVDTDAELTWDGDGLRLSGAARNVPWAEGAAAVLVPAWSGDRTVLALVLPESVTLTSGRNMAGERRDALRFDTKLGAHSVADTPDDLTVSAFPAIGAALRAAALAGALERVLDFTVGYAGERVQFGKPISQRQAIQHMIATMAAQVAAARSACELAGDAIQADGCVDVESIAAAKVVTSHAAGICAADAHQVHGAIGFTSDHTLQFLTRRLWAWRDEGGSDAYWSRMIGSRVLRDGADAFWSNLTARDGDAPREELRQEVRAFLSKTLHGRTAFERAQSWMGFDAGFSRKLGERNWLGMTMPSDIGGHERSPLERHIVMEELLAAGAPVAAHWIADRQSAPLILRFGTPEQAEKVVPGVIRGETFFCIGMSEPDSGSDLAAARTRARKVDGGWQVNGTKLWTTYAHRSHYMVLFCRTGSESDGDSDRHAGMSQFLVDLQTPGVTIRPILDLAGEHHFNEVAFDDVFLPDEALIGVVGQGWAQVTSELAFERSGPERFLSSITLLIELIRELGPDADLTAQEAIGYLAARLAVLRRMSTGVAETLAAGGDASLAATMVKDLGATFEQEIPEVARRLVNTAPSLNPDDGFAAILGRTMASAPSFSLRGGTREILRGIVARGLGLR